MHSLDLEAEIHLMPGPHTRLRPNPFVRMAHFVQRRRPHVHPRIPDHVAKEKVVRVQHDAHLADPAGSHRRAQGEIFGLHVGDKGVGRPPLELDVVMEWPRKNIMSRSWKALITMSGLQRLSFNAERRR